MDVCALVADFISRSKLLKKNQKVIVGVSGGADSLCLLDCLHRLRFDVILAHLDHQIRPESVREAEFCRQVAERYGIPAEIAVEDTGAFAESGRSLEEAARILRYRFLVRVAKLHKSSSIATGHTADDQVETILMHFLRGAGPEGLRGMLPRTSMEDWVDVPEGKGHELVRPLLEITREQTLAHCEASGLVPIQDPSNEDVEFLRNRLRHELLPDLETYNPGVRDALIRTGHIMAGIADLQQDILEEVWPEVVSEVGDQALLLHAGALLGKPVAVQRALLRRAVKGLAPGSGDIGFEEVGRWLAFIAARKMGSRQAIRADLELMNMGDDVLLWKAGSEVSFCSYPQLGEGERWTLEIPGELLLEGGWKLTASTGKMAPGEHRQKMLEASKQRVFLDADKIEGSLNVRVWEPGDRLQMLGMEGRTKVAEIFVNEHIPKLLRARWPLVVDGRQIIWVSGIRIAHGVRLTKTTKRYVELHLGEPE